jgi:hypothetical protein
LDKIEDNFQKKKITKKSEEPNLCVFVCSQTNFTLPQKHSCKHHASEEVFYSVRVNNKLLHVFFFPLGNGLIFLRKMTIAKAKKTKSAVFSILQKMLMRQFVMHPSVLRH